MATDVEIIKLRKENEHLKKIIDDIWEILTYDDLDNYDKTEKIIEYLNTARY